MTKLKLLCASVACAVWHFAVCASSYMYPTETVNDKEWSYFPMAGGVEIQKAPLSLSGHVVVPDTLGGLPVIGVRPQAFQACDGITSVTLPDTVREIGDYAFSGLEGLRAVYLPWGLEAIGERAFYGCGIERLYLPGTITRIGAYAFENNTSLEKVAFGSGMTAIGDYMFNGCTELRQLALPKTIEKVGTKPFVGNKLAYRGSSGSDIEPDNGIYVELSNEGDNLGSVSVCGKIRAQHPEIKFVSCLNREPSIFDPDGVWVHENTGSKVLLSFDYNDTILDVPYGEPLGAYLQNFGLSSFDWYDGVNGCEVAVDTVITDKFAGHSLSRRAREQSTFPMGDAQLKYIAHEKYIEVCGLDGNAPKTLVIPPEIDGLPVKVVAADAFKGSSSGFETVCLPSSLKVIGNSAFQDCHSLKSVSLPWGLETIGELAFDNCTGLVSMAIPGTVKKIGNSTFAGCTGLRSMVIGYGVTSVPAYFMDNATSLTDIEIPKTLTSVGACFCRCDYNGGKNLKIWCELDEEDEAHNDNIDRIDAMLAEKNPDIAGRNPVRFVSYGYQPRIVSLASFDGTAVTKEYGKHIALDLPDYPSNRRFVGWFADDGSEADEDTILPVLVNSYSAKYLDDEEPLPTETVEDSHGCEQTWSYVRHTDYAEVRGVDIGSLSSTLEIPSALGGLPVKVIGPSALAGNSRLVNVVIPDGVTAIRSRAFGSCSNLRQVVMPSSMRHIGYAAFFGCSSLYQIDIPDGVLSIGSSAFAYCDIVDVALPGTLKYAGEYIFANNPRLYRCTLLNGIEEVPPFLICGSEDFMFICIPRSVKRIGQQAFYFYKDGSKVLCDVVLDDSGRETKAEVQRVAAMVRAMFEGFYLSSAEWNALMDSYGVESSTPGSITCKFISENPASSVEKTIQVGSNLGLEIPNPPYRDGYTFVGWMQLLSHDIGVSPFQPITTPTEYIARYEAQVCQVVFYKDGGSGANVTNNVTSGSRVGELPGPGNYPGHAFGGWYTSPNGGGTRVTKDTVVTGNKSFFAYWILDTDTKYTITFDAGEGEGSFELVRTYGQKIGAESLSTPTKTGHVFLGWYSESLGGYVNPDATVTGDETYTARWQANTYTVQFSDGSFNSFKSNKKYGEALGALPNRSKDGWEFLGWFSSSGEQATAATPVHGSVTYYARWRDLGVLLTFDYNTPNGQKYELSVAHGYKLTEDDLSSVGRTGYDFDGWYTDRENGDKVSKGTTISEATTYYAHWNVKRHHVTLNLNYSTLNPVYMENDFDFGSPVSLLDQVPVREGVDFLGWYTEDGVRVNGSVTLPDANVTYYARWKEYYKLEYVGGDVGTEIVNSTGGSAWIGGEIPEMLEIPSRLDGQEITSIGRGAFMNCKGLCTVVMPNTVTRIGMWAFFGCSDLGSVTIPSSVRYIGEWAFAGTSITNVCVEFGYADYFKDMIRDSGYDVSGITFQETEPPEPFYGDFAIDGGLTIRCRIDGYDATILSVPNTTNEVVLPQYIESKTLPCRYAVRTIGTDAFVGHLQLQSLTIPSSVTNIADGAFSNGMEGEQQTLDHKVTVNVERGDIDRVQGLFGSAVPEKYMSNVEFSQPPATFEVTFDPNGGYFDSASPFYSWDIFAKEGDPIGYLPSEPKRKGMKFEGWCVNPDAYDKIMVDENYVPEGDTTVYALWSLEINWKFRRELSWEDGSYYYTITGVETEVGELPDELEVPDMIGDDPVRKIDVDAFRGLSSLRRITFPDSLEEVQEAFDGCVSLEEVVMPSGLKEIGYRAFAGCTALRSVTIPATVTQIGSYAFDGCTGLESVTIKPGVGGRSVSTFAFNGCTNLASVDIPDDVAFSPDGVFKGCSNLEGEDGFIVFRGALYDYLGDESAVVIPNGVTAIGQDAFLNLANVTSVQLPATLRTIGESAFSGCGLSSVEIPQGVTNIARSAFGNTTISTVSIPDSVVSVGWGAFPESAVDGTTIPGLAIVDGWVIAQALNDSESIDLSGIRGIGSDLFGNNGFLKEIKFSEAIQHIGENTLPYSLETVRVPKGEQARVAQLICETNPNVSDKVVVVETVPPTIVGDPDAVVVAREDGVGYDIYPTATDRPIDISIPEDCDPKDVKVNVPATAGKVKPNGADLRVANGGYDITEHLDMPAADGDGYVDVGAAQVKDEIVEKAIDMENLALDPEDPQVPVNTEPGLVYTFYEAETIDALAPSATKVGDGLPWNPPVNVKGGSSGFYTIGVDKR